MSCCPHHTEQQSKIEVSAQHHADHGQGEPEMVKDYLRRFYFVTFLLVLLLLLTETALKFFGLEDFTLRKYLQFGVATVIFYFALIFFEHARHEVKARQPGMMTLVSLAVGAGYLFSVASTFLPQLDAEFYIEISTLIWVLLFGHYLEARSSAAAGDALSEVAKLLPQTAHKIKVKGEEKIIEDVDIAQLKEDDIVLVKPGEKVPADAVILQGKANMDESLISGESRPVEKGKGAKVVAGSICKDGSIEVRIERVGENSTIGQIKTLISQAQKTKPRSQRLADKAAGVLTITAVSVAIVTVLIWALLVGKPLVFAFTLAITVLVIACPHALGLAIPTVTTIATSLAVKNGVFIKDLAKVETIKDIDYVVFDKTGTLTKGEFGVTNIIQSAKFKTQNDNSKLKIEEGQRGILQIAASLEQYSSHVIGLSIVKFSQEQGVELLEVTDFKNFAGQGIQGQLGGRNYFVGNEGLMKDKRINLSSVKKVGQEWAGQGKTVVYLSDETQTLGVFGLADAVKEESFSTVNKLHELGIKVAMLTGDTEDVAKNVAKKLGIDTYFAQVLPEDKYKKIKKLQEQGNKVVMVGDGINDAPALTQADVGVAIGAGTDVAVEAGDVVLTRSNPQDIVRLIVLSKKVYRKMVENLIWATGYNVIAIPAAAGLFAPFGFFLKPAIGALLMSLSSVIVVINAMLLKRVEL